MKKIVLAGRRFDKALLVKLGVDEVNAEYVVQYVKEATGLKKLTFTPEVYRIIVKKYGPTITAEGFVRNFIPDSLDGYFINDRRLFDRLARDRWNWIEKAIFSTAPAPSKTKKK